MKDLMLILHFIGLAMAVGTGFSNLFLGMVAGKLEPQERGSFMMKTSILIMMGKTGLVLLLISGFYMITPYWSVLGEMPLLVTKLVLVGILIFLVGMISALSGKAKRENNPALMAKVKPFGMAALFTGLAIVVCAVLTFH